MKIGFIGTGNMGTILIESFIESKAANPSTITITNRTIEKALKIKKRYSNIQVTESLEKIVTENEMIFICVKPLDIYPLLARLAPYIRKDQILISITSPVQTEQLEQVVSCQVARVIPSITNRALAGVSLVTFGKSCQEDAKTKINGLMRCISKPLEIESDITRVASDIVSCGPAFMSYLIQQFIEAAVSETSVSKQDAILMSKEMLVGLGKLLESELYTLPALQEKVCVKGGVTGEGIKALENGVQDMFNRVFQNTHIKYEEDISAVKDQFLV
ncbi:late competence protein ComER [Bacillus atrophaeus]|uniref:late competence protein ComER n=1 Tax=Bacillus atrophaeus TaxID=1452 RepID=UPI002DB7D263|nr:late competence protein ComER [Bacillus atrophaeus]MEC1903208.1 late competence protein ComER [Bacillus atrophaeus]MEC2399191.1 late competence protein ComER [Bacillus atrophaeus]MED4435391.1 late competence protein ComER [Bacillus atrophaeus]MED4567471.1 late competence protein ComER [Bacillus atrophaeus]MED4574401.1 late competence protein ComER [Bacillus atrophaeus]